MWDTRPVQLCSESEKWRAQAAIQLTLAAMTGSRAVVLDRADLLDAQQSLWLGSSGQPGIRQDGDRRFAMLDGLGQ